MGYYLCSLVVLFKKIDFVDKTDSEFHGLWKFG
jgi:hypothetical protein